MKKTLIVLVLGILSTTLYAQDLHRFKSESDLYGFKDATGKVVITAKYEYALSFSDGLARVRSNGKYGYINKTGKMVIPAIYDATYGFSKGPNGRAKVTLSGKYFFIDKSGKTVHP